MENIFLTACEQGLTHVCSKYIRKGLDLNCFDSNGCTGLMKACLNGHYELIKLLMNENVNINQKDFYGQNALHYATRGNHQRICKLLCAKNIDANEQNKVPKMIARDYSLVTVPKQEAIDPIVKDYIIKSRNIKKSEDPRTITEASEPQSTEEKIYNMLLRYENMELSDIESNEEDDGPVGEVYTKTKKKKSGKKGKGKSKGGGKKKKKKK